MRGINQKLLSMIIPVVLCVLYVFSPNMIGAADEGTLCLKSQHELYCSELLFYQAGKHYQDISGDIDTKKKESLMQNLSTANPSSSTYETYFETEPNNFRHEANIVNSNYYGQTYYYIFGTITNYYFDMDFFRFDVTKSGTFDVLGAWMGDYYGFGWEDHLGIALQDVHGNNIAFSVLKGTGSNRYQHLVASVSPGTYYIVVYQTSHYQYLYVGEIYGLSLEFYADPPTVSAPAKPSGPSSGITNTTYSYSTGGSVCSDGHNVQYRFDWGDGSFSNWSSSTASTKSWASPGSYQVKAQARCAVDTSVVSLWSSARTVSITEPEPVEIVVSSSNPTYGHVSGGGIYTHGVSVTVSASAYSGYRFVNWTEGSSVVSKSSSYTFTAQANRTLVANFKYEVDASRIYGSNRFTTAIQVSQEGWPNGANTVLLARADDFADALAGVPLAYHLDAPILLTATNQLHAATKEEIEGLEAERVILLGGIAAISDNVILELEAMGLTVERIAGAGRYDTAVEIAKRINNEGVDFNTAFIAVGTNFADALAASSYAAKRGEPILLTQTNRLPAATEDAFLELGIVNTKVCGGEAVISQDVYSKLPNPERIYGNNRYETAVALANAFMPVEIKHVCIATGLNFPDAIAGGVLAAKLSTGVLLVRGDRDEPNPVVQQFLDERQITSVTLFGGYSVISAEMESWF